MSNSTHQKGKPSLAPLCVYCGQQPGTTDDHVVARCFFDNKPQNMITVSTCNPCNQRKKDYDTYLRDGIVNDVQVQSHPAVQRVLNAKFKRANMRKQSQYGKEDLPHLYYRPYSSPEGVYLGLIPAAPINVERFNGAIKYIVRGLSYHFNNVHIPLDYSFKVSRVDPLSNQQAIDAMKYFQHKGPYFLGDVFSCMYSQVEKNPAIGFWLLCFYSRMIFTVITDEPT
jgi:hypothetical protein